MKGIQLYQGGSPPASTTNTLLPSFAANLAAKTHPDVPAPTLRTNQELMKSFPTKGKPIVYFKRIPMT